MSEQRHCVCAIPDPVMQADRRFYCHKCSLPRPSQLCEQCQRIVVASPASAVPEDLRADIEQAARLLRSWAGARMFASGKWTTQEQAAVDCAIRLESALSARAPQPEGGQ